MKTDKNNTVTIITIVGVSTLTFLGVKYLSRSSNKIRDKIAEQVKCFLDNAE